MADEGVAEQHPAHDRGHVGPLRLTSGAPSGRPPRPTPPPSPRSPPTVKSPRSAATSRAGRPRRVRPGSAQVQGADVATAPARSARACRGGRRAASDARRAQRPPASPRRAVRRDRGEPVGPVVEGLRHRIVDAHDDDRPEQRDPSEGGSGSRSGRRPRPRRPRSAPGRRRDDQRRGGLAGEDARCPGTSASSAVVVRLRRGRVRLRPGPQRAIGTVPTPSPGPRTASSTSTKDGTSPWCSSSRRARMTATTGLGCGSPHTPQACSRSRRSASSSRSTAGT